MQFNYDWNLKETKFTKDKGTVFSTFACGGGSTMGYKLAGFDVLGCNEIDSKMMDSYIKNHNPKYSFLEPIQEFKNRKDFPKEFYELDILDGSPPCSSFSMAGNREKDWGKEKHFREGQTEQVLDTLFFDFIDLAKELQPKVVIAENVKGITFGSAIKYVREIYKQFDEAGYYCQHFLLDSSKMGVPQIRERVFFICLRKDLASPFLVQKDLFDKVPEINLDFNEKKIPFKKFGDYQGRDISDYAMKAWAFRKFGDINIAQSKKHADMHISDMNTFYVYDDKVCRTLTSKGEFGSLLFSKPIRLSKNEFLKIGSFPLDYEFIYNDWGYIVGMSVPPVMMAMVAHQVYEQWLSKI